MVNVNQRTATGIEDVVDTSDGGFPGFDSDGPLHIGFIDPRAIYTGCRFPSVNISGTVDDADLTFKDLDFGTGTPDVLTDIFCEDVSGSPGVWSDGDGPPDRATTTASVTWDYQVGGDATVTTPDFASVVQELVDSFTTVTHLHVVILGNSAGNTHDVDDFETDAATCPLLDLNYTAAGVSEFPAWLPRPMQSLLAR